MGNWESVNYNFCCKKNKFTNVKVKQENEIASLNLQEKNKVLLIRGEIKPCTCLSLCTRIS